MDDRRPCEWLEIGDVWGWTMMDGTEVAGIVTEIDSNVVFIRDGSGREWAYES